MTMLIEFIVCFIAGIGAGLGTGFAGMSAAAVISPMLITFLDMPAYEAVGIALASDVLASAVSAYTYGKNKKSGHPQRCCDDGIGFVLYHGGQLGRQPGAQQHDGQFLGIYDIPARR